MFMTMIGGVGDVNEFKQKNSIFSKFHNKSQSLFQESMEFYCYFCKAIKI